MSLSARIALKPSRSVAQAGLLIPLLGLFVATTTVVARWPTQRMPLLVAAVIAAVSMIGLGLRRLRATRRTVHLTLSDRADIDVRTSVRPGLDGSARLAESTVVWPGFWMVALRPTDGAPVIRIALRPRELEAQTRRSLARFLVWSVRARGARLGEREKARS